MQINGSVMLAELYEPRRRSNSDMVSSRGTSVGTLSPAATRSVLHREAQRPAAEIFQCEFAFARIKQTTVTRIDHLIILLGGFNAQFCTARHRSSTGTWSLPMTELQRAY